MRASAFTVVAVFTLLLYAHALTLDSTHMQPGILNTRVGGLSRPIFIQNEANLTGDLKVFNQFVRNNIPQVQGKELISYRQQVVAGVRYCCDYGKRTNGGVSDSVEVCLLSQPWRRGYLELDSPEGRKISVNTEEITWPIKFQGSSSRP